MELLHLSMTFLLRAKVRTCLAITAMAVAFTLVGALDAVRLVFDSDSVGKLPRLVVTSLRSINEGLPSSTLQVYEQLGIPANRISWANWVGGYYQDPSTPIANIAISSSYLQLYPELHVSEETLNQFAKIRDAAIVGKQLAEEHHWHVGERIRLLGVPYQARDTVDSGWSYEIAGTFEVDDKKLASLESQFFSRWDYFDSMALYGHGQVGWFIINAGSWTDENALVSAIDRATENSPNPTHSQTEQSFQRQLANQVVNIGWLTRGLIALALLFVLILTSKVMAQSIHESMREIGILKAIGFNDDFLLAMMVTQGILVVLISAILGLLTATASVSFLRSASVSSLGVLLQPVSARVWIDALFIAMVAGVLVSIVPSMKTSRTPTARLLRG